ncbi:MAG TPA: FAD-binding oxidoreductase [Syntrophorhabdaceae bacterium]|nr:FAD-binding oxidoreductase [Syntrophorhabdaceae bacterium]HPA07216.1 FAD-binding oxidoreductase [Methanoregulaceae archaeon]
MSTMTLQSIQEEYGDRATASPLERELYSRDLGPVPALMVDPLFRTRPDLIVRPGTTEEIANLVRRCGAEGIPVTPRAGASTVFFNAVPVKAGVVIDLNALTGVVALDEAGMTVTVKASTTWSDLEAYLNAGSLACKTVPSSAPAATIGGWLCMMGHGIGSLKYGSLLSQVRSIEAVLPDGTVKRISRTTEPSLDWFAASEGTLGIITEVELEVRPLRPMRHFLLHIPDNHAAVQVMNLLMAAQVMPYNLHFSDSCFVRAMQDLGLSQASPNPGGLLLVDYEGGTDELAEAGITIQKILKEYTSVTLLSESLAQTEWDERYKSIRIKRGGPAVLGGELLLPVNSLAGYLDDIRKMADVYSVNFLSYAHVVSPEQALVMSMFFADETKTLQYIINLSLVKKIQDAGYRHGGCPYGIGLWNTPYLRRIYSSSQLTVIRERKRKLDPLGIMNPGKVYRTPFMLNALNFSLGMEVLAGVRRIFGKGW